MEPKTRAGQAVMEEMKRQQAEQSVDLVYDVDAIAAAALQADEDPQGIVTKGPDKMQITLNAARLIRQLLPQKLNRLSPDKHSRETREALEYFFYELDRCLEIQRNEVAKLAEKIMIEQREQRARIGRERP